MEMNTDQARHLFRRLAFTATPALMPRARGQEPATVVSTLIADGRAAALPDFSQPGRVTWRNTALRTKGMSAAQYEELRAVQVRAARLQVEVVRQLWLRELVSGPSPLRENLVLFFHGTFGSSSTAVEIAEALAGTNAVLRRSAFGTIPALLDQLVLDAGMMIQIGMDEHGIARVSDRPAKLILDHWTVGPGEYADRDVEELSRALTGWSLAAPEGTPAIAVDPTAPRVARRTGLVPTFDRGEFDDGAKTILGTTSAFDARAAMALLARRPATARRYARLLIRHLGIEDPRGTLAARLEKTYLSTDGSIEALLREAVAANEFWSDASRWSLVKSPVHLVSAACRQLDIAAPDLPALSQFVAVAGQTLFDTPNGGEGGWPGQDAWVTPADRLGVRYQLPVVLAGRMPPLGVRDAATAPAATAPALPLGEGWKNASGATLLTRLDPAPGVGIGSVRRDDVIRYVMATPQYQLA